MFQHSASRILIVETKLREISTNLPWLLSLAVLTQSLLIDIICGFDGSLLCRCSVMCAQKARYLAILFLTLIILVRGNSTPTCRASGL